MTTPVTGPVLVLLDHDADGGLRPPTLELLTAGRALGAVHGAWIADGSDPDEGAIEVLGTYGVETVHVVDVGDADARLTPVAADGLTAVVQRAEASVLLLTSSFENKEIAARVGIATGAGVVVDASGLEVEADRVVAAKTVFAGTWNTRCAVRTPLAVIALKPGSVQAEPPAEPTTVALVRQAVTVDDGARRVQVAEHTERAASTRPDLGAAAVVVVGGRGTNGDFALLEELADLLGGAVGATRVATDEGWIGRDAQIGQTGVTVAPQLYIGAGVSGAVHHRGGMQSAGTIVAINSDPEAPIFEIADFGIVGDLFAVVPQTIAELRRLRG
ncbi:MAG: electron transfer flavoprotein subunit alpha/FixB family protein [Cellulomonas sp.]